MIQRNLSPKRGPNPTFSDNFASGRDPNEWQADSFDEGGDALWVNDPSLINSIYVATGGHLDLNLRQTPGPSFTSAFSSAFGPPQATQGGAAITKPYVSGIMDTFNSGAFTQQYGYWEVTISVDKFIGLIHETIILTPPPFNFAAFVPCRIWTDSSNVQHVDQFSYGGGSVYSTDSNSGWDASVPHRYGLNWTASIFEFYRDRVRVSSDPNPGADYNHPFYTKLHCNTNFGPTATAITNPGGLPKAAHLFAFNVWATKPF